MQQYHNIEPVFDKDSRILILGSFPSVKSRESQFFYGHPQNRFWKVLEKLYDSEKLVSVEDKKTFLLKNGIALWDVIGSCDIAGSADSSIKEIVPNDIRKILDSAKIETIYCNGNTSYKNYCKYLEPSINRKAVLLPSTSPANAAWSLQRLCDAWKIICPQ